MIDKIDHVINNRRLWTVGKNKKSDTANRKFPHVNTREKYFPLKSHHLRNKEINENDQ